MREFICCKHWQALPLRERKAYMRRQKRNLDEEVEVRWRLWRWLRRRAIERAVGI